MPTAHAAAFEPYLAAGARPLDVPALVDAILREARSAGASDVHLCPTADGIEMKWRLDGVLQRVGELPRACGPQLVARLKVLADLLTYQTELPQEGRIRPWRDGDGSGKPTAAGADVETRLSTFPTLFGEKAVVRLFVGSGRHRRLDELGLPGDVRGELGRLLTETGGVILLTGPAGSGKTTTAYACLREIVGASEGRRSVVSIEDPIEAVLPGVDQAQVNLHAGFDLPTGLRSVLRQDPDVLLVGEIRDRPTAETTFQASLTGHLVLTTFHAGSAARAAGRLLDMDIEPYLLRSGLLGVLCQRLARRLCGCATETNDPAARLGLPLDCDTVRRPVGCGECRGTGYRGRFVLTEFLLPDRHGVGPHLLGRDDADTVEAAAVARGMAPLSVTAAQAVREGRTSPEEYLRLFGLPRRGALDEHN